MLLDKKSSGITNSTITHLKGKHEYVTQNSWQLNQRDISQTINVECWGLMRETWHNHQS